MKFLPQTVKQDGRVARIGLAAFHGTGKRQVDDRQFTGARWTHWAAIIVDLLNYDVDSKHCGTLSQQSGVTDDDKLR